MARWLRLLPASPPPRAALCYEHPPSRLRLHFRPRRLRLLRPGGKSVNCMRQIISPTPCSWVSNSLSGAIPDLTALVNLKVLYLNDNRFSGRIPATLAVLHHLKVVILSDNLLSGPIPVALAGVPRLYTFPSRILFRVISVKAEPDADEVFAQVTLLPEKQDENAVGKETLSPPLPQPHVHSFCKTLTASDASTHGGFSVLKRHADESSPTG